MSEKLSTAVAAVPDPDFVPDDEKLYLRYRDKKSVFDDPLIEAAPKRDPDQVRRFFEQSKAEAYIEIIAVYSSDGKLDIEASSQQLGIPIVYDSDLIFAGKITGIGIADADEPIKIHIRPDNEDKTITFGHEAGHYFYRQVLGMRPRKDYRDLFEEEFCEYFGRAMAMPKSVLKNLSEIDEELILELARRYELTFMGVIRQLQEYELLPPRVAIDTYNEELPNANYSHKVTRGVVCKHCNDTGGDRNCPLAGQDGILFDFTDRDLGGYVTQCCGEDLHTPEIASTLTKHYQSLGRFPVLRLFDIGSYR